MASQLLPLIAMQLDCRHKYISLALLAGSLLLKKRGATDFGAYAEDH